MARAHKLPGTEVHVTCLPDTDGRFTHIEYRAYETIRVAGASSGRCGRRRARASTPSSSAAFYDTALHDAREISGEMAVTAPAASPRAEIAASLANRFASSSGGANGSSR